MKQCGGEANDSDAVIAVVVLPGPINGMTLATGEVIAALRGACSLRVFDVSGGRRLRGWRWKLYRNYRGVLGAAMLWYWLRRGPSTVYVAPNSSWGLWQTWLLTRIAKRFGCRIVVHHHVFSYAARRSRWMSAIQKMLDANDLNIVLSPEMRSALTDQYAPQARFLVLPYGYMARDLRPSSRDRRDLTPFYLGHLSNLTIAKGLPLVLKTFDVLRARGVDARLILAGPLEGARERALVEAARARHGAALDYRGPVYDGAKRAFFADVDLLLFPTEYQNEAQPVTIVEALACGVPVIAYGRGCIPSMFPDGGGVVLDPEVDFPSAAAPHIERLIKNPAELESFRHDAARSAVTFKEASERGLRALVDLMSRPQPAEERQLVSPS